MNVWWQKLQAWFWSAIAWCSRIGWWKVGIVGGLVLLAAIFGITKLTAVPTEQPTLSIRQVEVLSVGELSSQTTPLSIIGSVESRSEATVRAEKSGRIVSINYSLGDRVGAGSVVASIESSAERAAVLQAQGTVDAAQANLNKVQKGTRGEQLAILQAAESAARSGGVNTLFSSYASVDSAVRGTTDKMFTSVETQPKLHFFIPDPGQTIKIEDARLSISKILDRERGRSASLSTSDDISAEITQTEIEIRSIRDFLDMLIAALNIAVPNSQASSSDIAAYLASATAARATMNSTLSSLSSARQAITTAENNLKQGVNGAQPEDVAAAQAALTQARGSLASASAALERAIIRAPIGGTINSFDLKIGDYVQATTPVVTIANNGSLEVVAYITENDSREIAAGQSVAFEGGATGIVTKIAPALDPVTKKIEVRIGISDPSSTLVNGQSVLVKISRLAPKVKAGERVTIPIAAIKVEANRTVVYTVREDSTLEAHEITLGALLGDRVVVQKGVTADMRIVVDARGLREGQKVQVK